MPCAFLNAVRILIWMPLKCQLLVRLLNLVGSGVVLHAKHLVVALHLFLVVQFDLKCSSVS